MIKGGGGVEVVYCLYACENVCYYGLLCLTPPIITSSWSSSIIAAKRLIYPTKLPMSIPMLKGLTLILLNVLYVAKIVVKCTNFGQKFETYDFSTCYGKP